MQRAGGSEGDELSAVAPGLVDMTNKVLYGDVWERDGLARRDRCLLTIAALVAGNHHLRLEAHFRLALKSGVTVEELGEAMLHLAFYSSWPNAVAATRVLYNVVNEQKSAEAG